LILAALGTQTRCATTPPTGTTQQPISQGSGPPAPQPLNCADYKCDQAATPAGGGGGRGGGGGDDDRDPFAIRVDTINAGSLSSLSTPCQHELQPLNRPCNTGGGTCYGSYCLNIQQGIDYCICEYHDYGTQCASEKPGKCEGSTGKLRPNAYQGNNKRYRQQSDPDYGSVTGRHFVVSFDDCVKLCQWAAPQCRSINFGVIAGQNVCEMLAITVEKGGILEKYLVNAQGWKHAQVVF